MQPHIFKILTGISPLPALLSRIMTFKIKNDIFDFIGSYMRKSESDVVFEMFFDNSTTGIVFKFLTIVSTFFECISPLCSFH